MVTGRASDHTGAFIFSVYTGFAASNFSQLWWSWWDYSLPNWWRVFLWMISVAVTCSYHRMPDTGAFSMAKYDPRSVFMSWLVLDFGGPCLVHWYTGSVKYNYQVKKLKLAFANLPLVPWFEDRSDQRYTQRQFQNKTAVNRGVDMIIQQNRILFIYRRPC